MRIALLLVLIAIPLLELAVLIKVGQWIGLWPTLALLVATAVLGTMIVASQSFAALARASESVERGQLPIEPVIDSVFLLLAGALLVTPGFITDLAAIPMLIPPVRLRLARWLFKQLISAAQGEVDGAREGARQAAGSGDDGGIIIEGEFERIDEPDATMRRRHPPAEPS